MTDLFHNILRFYSDWKPINLLIAGGGLAFFILLIEVSFSVALFHNPKHIKNKRKAIIPPWTLKIIRVFLRFLLLYGFSKIIQSSAVPQYPWNLLFHAPSLLLLYSGILFTLFKALSVLEKKKFSDFPMDSSKQKLLVVSRRGLKTTFSLIILSILLWNVLNLFPAKVRASGIVTVVIIANGVLLLGFLFLVVHQFFTAAEGLYKHKKGRSSVKIIMESLSMPIRILILAFAVVWMKTLVPNAPGALNLLNKVINFLLVLSLFIFIYRASEILGSKISRYSDEETNSLDKTLVEMLRMILRIFIITAAVFAVIRIFTGQPLTTLLAGLGIGGLAVALAAQDTLKNFFGSIMIISDKPFKIGERVVAEGYDGVVEGIGFRSTRIRTLTGHQVVIPNDKMALISIENIGRRPYIRRLTNITITYDTPVEKVDRALAIIRGILENHEGMPEDFPPRVHFSEFNPDSLNIQVLYWYSPPDYWKYMEFTERVNLQIMTEFNREGIKFAFPSSTTYLEQSEGQSLHFDINGEGKREKNNQKKYP